MIIDLNSDPKTEEQMFCSYIYSWLNSDFNTKIVTIF